MEHTQYLGPGTPRIPEKMARFVLHEEEDLPRSLLSPAPSSYSDSLAFTNDGESPAFNCVSPLLAPVRDPFAGGVLPRPTPLNLCSQAFDAFSRDPFHESVPTATPSPGHTVGTLFDACKVSNPLPQTNYAQRPTSNLSLPRHPSNPKEPRGSVTADTESRQIVNEIPTIYEDVSFSITTYRWLDVEDTVRGTPVCEIRPYNKSDGKRYVYIRVNGLDELKKKCTRAGIRIPKAHFRVERVGDNLVLGNLTVREGDQSDVRGNESSIDDLETDQVELNRQLTLLISESIVQRLDADGVGRGSPPPEEHRLRIVVSLIVERGNEGACASLVEVALMHFYRIKRRQKKRMTYFDPVSDSGCEGKKARVQPTGASTALKQFSRATTIAPVESRIILDEKLCCNIPAPLINTAPGSEHFADFFCAKCGPSKSVKLISSEQIYYVDALNNQIWTTGITPNCLMEVQTSTSGSGTVCKIICSVCRSQLGEYYQNEGLESGSEGITHAYRFSYVHPGYLSPMLFYRWNGTVNMGLAPRSKNGYPGVSESELPSAISSTRAKTSLGWVGEPLMEASFPSFPGAYPSVDKIVPLTCPSPFLRGFRPESRLLEMVHGLECSTDAAWICRAALPMQEGTLSKLSVICEQFEIRQMMHMLDHTNPALLSEHEYRALETQLFEKLCSLFG